MHRSFHNDVELRPNIHDVLQAWRIEVVLRALTFACNYEK